MRELEVQSQGTVIEAPPTESAWIEPASPAPPPEIGMPVSVPAAPAPRRPEIVPAAPIVLVDPRSWTLDAARSLRAAGARVVVLSGCPFEPALHTRGVQGHRLPPLGIRPERWAARLLELAARLEPRAVVYACSLPAVEFLRAHRRQVEPHFTLANIHGLEPHPAVAGPDAALRQSLLRGDAALEVQIARDRHGEIVGLCVLAWAPGAPPDVLVTGVDGSEVAARSRDLLEARRYVGYARLVWAPDRFGHLVLHAASSVPGSTIELARADGVDFATLAYRIAAGATCPPQRARGHLVRRLPTVDPEGCSSDAPVVALPQRFSRRDPLPWLAGLLRGLLRP